MPHCADGEAGIYHKRGSIPAGLNSHRMCLRGNNVDVFPFKEQLYNLIFYLKKKTAVYEEHLQGLTLFMKGFSFLFFFLLPCAANYNTFGIKGNRDSAALIDH